MLRSFLSKTLLAWGTACLISASGFAQTDREQARGLLTDMVDKFQVYLDILGDPKEHPQDKEVYGQQVVSELFGGNGQATVYNTFNPGGDRPEFVTVSSYVRDVFLLYPKGCAVKLTLKDVSDVLQDGTGKEYAQAQVEYAVSGLFDGKMRQDQRLTLEWNVRLTRTPRGNLAEGTIRSVQQPSRQSSASLETVKADTPAKSRPAVLKGAVRDDTDESPIPGASIKLGSGAVETATDLQGRFTLKEYEPHMKGDTLTIEVSAVGYGAFEVSFLVQGSSDELVIPLPRLEEALSSVVEETLPPITGVVLDAMNGGVPMPGASVLFGQGYGVVANIDGNFYINDYQSHLEGGALKITVQYLGYITEEYYIDVQDAPQPLQIKLYEKSKKGRKAREAAKGY